MISRFTATRPSSRYMAIAIRGPVTRARRGPMSNREIPLLYPYGARGRVGDGWAGAHKSDGESGQYLSLIWVRPRKPAHHLDEDPSAKADSQVDHACSTPPNAHELSRQTKGIGHRTSAPRAEASNAGNFGANHQQTAHRTDHNSLLINEIRAGSCFDPNCVRAYFGQLMHNKSSIRSDLDPLPA